MAKYIIGIDFGTDSVRSVVIDADSGKEVSTHVSYYPRWMEGKFSDPSKNQFRQHPLDHIEALEDSVTGALKKGGNIGGEVIGIGVDTTGSTPAPVDREGNVLASKDEFKDNPNAMFVLWKDHTAVKEAEEINRLAKNWGGEDFTKYEGGVYSSEWFWAKILHIMREDKKVGEACFSWVEHADWVPAILTGITDPLEIKRSRCAAGHKAMWHADWGGLPSAEFLEKLDPALRDLRDNLYSKTYTSDKRAGSLSSYWAKKLGLKEGIAVAVGAFDAHMGAVGAQVKDKTFVKILGTSCCDVAVTPRQRLSGKLVAGICGQVDGSVIPEMIGLEAGQSSFGDVYAWFKDMLSWPLENLLPEGTNKKQIEEKIIPALTKEAEKIRPEETGLLALDWLNGRRTPYADQTLKGAIIGLTLGTTAPKIFRALVEATAFGAKAIVERFREEKIEIEEVVGIGGISQKSSFVMQVLSDVLDMPVKVAKSSQAVALGAAMFGAVASGHYKNVREAQDRMGSGFSTVYKPNQENAKIYANLYKGYIKLGKDLEDHLRKLK